MIILHEYPLPMVEHERFRDFINSLQPMFKMVSRNTVRRDTFNIYEEKRKSIMKLLEDSFWRTIKVELPLLQTCGLLITKREGIWL